jgi:hypothetical protein
MIRYFVSTNIAGAPAFSVRQAATGSSQKPYPLFFNLSTNLIFHNSLNLITLLRIFYPHFNLLETWIPEI